jgi:hypothetical protein
MAVAHWPRRPPSSARPLSLPNWRALPPPRLLAGVAETSPLHRFRPVPGYGACRFRRACTVKRMADAVPSILPREDKATATRVLSPSGEGLGVAVGASCFYADPHGFRLASLPSGRFLGEAAMTNAGPSAGMWRCMSPHVFAIVMARSARLPSALRPMAPSMPTHKDHEKDVGAEACPRSWVEVKADAATGHVRQLTPQRGGDPKGLRRNPKRRARP